LLANSFITSPDIEGRESVRFTADAALRHAQYFGISPDFWMNLTKIHDLDLARKAIRKAFNPKTSIDRVAQRGCLPGANASFFASHFQFDAADWRDAPEDFTAPSPSHGQREGTELIPALR
jgi:hypothetical protein